VKPDNYYRGILAEDLRKAAERVGLRVGAKIEIITPQKEYAGEVGVKKRTGEVIAIGNHYFTCKMDRGWVENFRHNQLINNEMGGPKIKLKG